MTTQPIPWQLRMFKKTLKKQQRLHELQKLIGQPKPDEKCLLITCGDNNGAMNWHLRELGGKWSWADLEDRSIQEMSELLGDPVHYASATELPFEDGEFQRIISIDVMEHIKEPEAFASEVKRIAAPNGQVILTVPGGDQTKLANRMKEAVGMSKGEYGHERDGYSVTELADILKSVGIHHTASITFSRFFTELVELAINFAYVKKMSSKSKVKVDKGTIAPATEEQLRAVEKVYRLYSLVFPFMWLFSKLDLLVFFTSGYVSMVEGRTPQRSA